MDIARVAPYSQKRYFLRCCRSPEFQLLLLLCIGVALYYYTLPYPFVFDDRVLLMQNPLITSSAGFFDLFDVNNFVPEYLPRLNDPDMVSSFVLRPVAYITFRLNYLLGGMAPAGFRTVNIAIHIANAIMLYQFLRCFIIHRTGRQETGAIVSLPLFAALLFLVHPLQTESVTYVTQRFTSLGTSYYLATMLLYLLSDTGRSRMSRRCFYVASLVSLIVGMLTKEFVITAPFALLLMSCILLHTPLWTSLRRLSLHLACLAIVPTLVMILSADLSTKEFSLDSATKIIDFNGYSTVEYAITQLRVVLSYFRLLVLPYGQNFDPDYPLFKSINHPEIFVSVMIWGLFIAVLIGLLRKSGRSMEEDMVVFSLILFPLMLSISSSVIPLPDLMSEHRTYLPSVAFCMGMTAHIYSLRHRLTPVWSLRITMGLCMLVALFGLLTVQRNFVYASRISLWSDTASKNPMKARPALALGNAYVETQQDDKAIEWLMKAVTLNPNYLESYLSLGSLFQDLSMPYNAIDLYESYLSSHESNPRILSNLALAYREVGVPDRAITALQLAVELDPDDEMLRIFLAENLYLLDRGQEAEINLNQAKALDQANPLVDYSAIYKMLEQDFRGNPLTVESHTGKVIS